VFFVEILRKRWYITAAKSAAAVSFFFPFCKRENFQKEKYSRGFYFAINPVPKLSRRLYPYFRRWDTKLASTALIGHGGLCLLVFYPNPTKEEPAKYRHQSRHGQEALCLQVRSPSGGTGVGTTRQAELSTWRVERDFIDFRLRKLHYLWRCAT
jgi:hypothetical protein